jgi:hypothetical protein
MDSTRIPTPLVGLKGPHIKSLSKGSGGEDNRGSLRSIFCAKPGLRIPLCGADYLNAGTRSTRFDVGDIFESAIAKM